MEYYLMFHIDLYGKKGFILHKEFDLLKMDYFIINNFMNRDEAFNYYIQDISEFCLDNKKIIESENIRNNHNRTGAITLFCKYQINDQLKIIKIPIIYGNDNKLLSHSNCLKIIKEKLNDNNILKKILSEKNYLLSRNEYDLLSLYFKFHNEKHKELFRDSFIRRIKNFTKEKKYFFFRCLMNLCSLNKLELKIQNGILKINNNIPLNTDLDSENDHKKIKLESNSLDDYFDSLIEKEDYDTLNKYYDIDFIEKNSNIRSTK